jgi:hypothetical protein
MRHEDCKVGMVVMADDASRTGTITYIDEKPFVHVRSGSVPAEFLVNSSDLHQKPMTVGDLVRALQGLPQELLIETEGCDCTGDVGQVTRGATSVMLERTKR